MDIKNVSGLPAGFKNKRWTTCEAGLKESRLTPAMFVDMPPGMARLPAIIESHYSLVAFGFRTGSYTDKNKIKYSSYIYKEIHNGAVTKSHMTNGSHIWLNICAFPHILGSRSS
jgi:hypothetical protein